MHLLGASNLVSVAADFNMEQLLRELPGPSGSSGLCDNTSMMSQGSRIDLSVEEDLYSPPSLAPVFWSSNYGNATEHGDSVTVEYAGRLLWVADHQMVMAVAIHSRQGQPVLTHKNVKDLEGADVVAAIDHTLEMQVT